MSTEQTTEAVATQLFTSAEEFIGKIVTLVNIKSPTSKITGKVTDVTISDNDGQVHVHDITLENIGKHSLWTEFKNSPYASTHWYWTVESIA